MVERQAVEAVIEARDLDTDERSQMVLPAIRPASEREREDELRSMIARVHPDARFRSFARDVATALGPQHLVVAHYIGSADTQEGPSSAASGPARQGELFAA